MKQESVRHTFTHLSRLSPEEKKAVIHLLYENANAAIAALIGVTLVVGTLLSRYLPLYTVALWLLPTLAVEFYRLYIVSRSRQHPDPSSEDRRYRQYVIATLVNAFLIGSMFYFILPLDALSDDTSMLRAFIFVVLLGVASAAVNTLSADARISALYLTFVLLPIPLTLIYHGGSIYYMIAILAVFYLVIQINAAVTYSKTLLREHRHKQEILSARSEIERLSYYDPLTSLKNRRGLNEDLERLFHTDNPHAQAVLFYLDLDNFRYINNTFGHSIGDAVLAEIAKRLVHSLSDRCQLYRIGGDEFIALHHPDPDGIDSIHDIASRYSRKLFTLFDDPFTVADVQMPVKCSIGVAIADTRYHTMEQISHYADIAMYQAKRTKSRKPVMFTPKLERENQALLQLRNDLTNRLRYEQLEIHYQPIVSIADDRLIGAEALVRWRQPGGKLVPPDRFIPLAIELNLIHTITWWIARHIFEQIRTWKANGYQLPGYVSINVNPSQLAEKDFADKLLSMLEEYQVDPRNIRLEITEITLIEDTDTTRITIEKLKHHGVMCMLDDFGSGYSYISYLNLFPLAAIKMDKSFVDKMLQNSKDLILTKYIIDVAERLGYDVVAEGIETIAQKEALYAMKQHVYYQGYLYAKACPGDEFETAFLTPAA
jgi:diguanylate cyclase (GGDEF)-like protein